MYVYVYEIICMIKVKLSLCFTKHEAMKTYWWTGVIAPRIPCLNTKRRAINFTGMYICMYVCMFMYVRIYVCTYMWMYIRT